MATSIHADSLKTYRARKHWTQEQLAVATKGPNKVSLPTIKRIESTKDGTYLANDRVAEALAKALGVKIEDLSQPPPQEEDQEASLRKFGYRPLRTMLDAETALAFNMVQHIYGIPIRSQIEMAPLFAALLAEGSLAWRRKRVEAIEEASAHLQELGGGHCSFVYATWRVDEGAAEERESIEERDLFGVRASEQAFDCGYDRSTNNPFADYLEMFAQEAQAKTIAFDKDFGWKTSEGLPKYRIGADIISQLTGDDSDAEYALLRGHVRLKDIPADLLSDEKKSDRVAWMIARIPEVDLARRKAERDELSALLGDLDIARPTQSPDVTGDGDHA
ncbi:MAG: XRE family transcriptional regulator [Rhodospirillales bacterium]|nr:MAG: XRE family transcriptional regulator [Rhodospirillales bacterium]